MAIRETISAILKTILKLFRRDTPSAPNDPKQPSACCVAPTRDWFRLPRMAVTRERGSCEKCASKKYGQLRFNSGQILSSRFAGSYPLPPCRLQRISLIASEKNSWPPKLPDF